MRLHDPDPDGALRLERRGERARQRAPRRLLRRALRWTSAIVVLAVLASVVLVGTLRWAAPPSSAFMLRERVHALVQRHPQPALDYRWVGWERISPHAALAVLAAEDQRFPEHHGFDVEAIQKAWSQYRAGGRLRGASTISQQVAKNLFLWPGKSFLRKGLEAYFTVLIETLWPKRRILEVYLNLAQLGEGLYGVEAASRRFFAKPASDLEAHEAALLAAVLPNPLRFDAARPSGWVLERRDWILRQMRQLGGIGYLERL